MSDSDKIVIRRLKKKRATLQEQYGENFEAWVGYWRNNIQRFITEFLGLPLYDFQKILMWEMKNATNYIYIASRGAAKSSIALDFACAMCILYPGLKVLVVCPVKSQSKQFVKKIYEYMRMSKNLELELFGDSQKGGIFDFVGYRAIVLGDIEMLSPKLQKKLITKLKTEDKICIGLSEYSLEELKENL